MTDSDSRSRRKSPSQPSFPRTRAIALGSADESRTILESVIRPYIDAVNYENIDLAVDSPADLLLRGTGRIQIRTCACTGL